jgi:NAD(P)-dependent dehydrogenase (short-subunit alcohol dehydrogenase family)
LAAFTDTVAPFTESRQPGGPRCVHDRVMTKTVLITGASSGIGRATAVLMVRHGWQVAATAFRLDVTDQRSIAEAVARVLARFGRIDVLVNNAGFGVFGPLEGASAADVEDQLCTNLVGTIATIRHVLPVMRQQGAGTIVNVSSLGGRVAMPFASLYHASKFAIEGLSESLRYEASLHGVRVKVVEPAHFRTGFIARSLRLLHHDAYHAAFSNYMGWVRAEDRKAPPPDPVAETIMRAATDPSSRLRYPVGGAGILALTRLLPDALFRSLLAGGMTRAPRPTSLRPEA